MPQINADGLLVQRFDSALPVQVLHRRQAADPPARRLYLWRRPRCDL